MTDKQNITPEIDKNIEGIEINIPDFSDKEISELAGKYTNRIFYDLDNNINKIKKTILTWKIINNGLFDNNLTIEKLGKINDKNKLKLILKILIYQYFNNNLFERKMKEKLLIKKMEEISGLKLDIIHLLTEINKKIGDKNFDKINKKLEILEKKDNFINLDSKNNGDNTNKGNNGDNINNPKKFIIVDKGHNQINKPVGGKQKNNQINNQNNNNYEYLWKNISIENVNQEVNKIMNKLKLSGMIKGNLTKIGNIKNLRGETILINTRPKPFFHEKATPDLIAMAIEFHKITGEALKLSNGFRTNTDQRRLLRINQKKGILTALPGKSRHNSGIAFDVKKTSRYNKKIGGINGFRALAKKHNFDKINSENRHFEHRIMKKVIGYNNRIKVSEMLDKNYKKYRA